MLLLLIGTWLRLSNLFALPMFIDEGIHIDRATSVMRGQWFVGLRVSKALHPIFLAIFRPSGIESLWIARAASAIVSLISCAGCVALGRQLDHPRTGLLAGALYVLLPFAVFHERQALVDPLFTVFTTTILVLSIWQARRPRLWIACMIGLALAGAFLTRILALPYLIVPFVALALFGRRDALSGLLYAALAAGLATALVLGFYGRARLDGIEPAPVYQLSDENIASTGLSEGELLRRLSTDLADLGGIYGRYAGPITALLAVLAVSLLVIPEERRPVIYLAIPAFAFLAMPLLANRPTGALVPRYLLMGQAPLVTLAALSWRTLIEKARPLPLPGYVLNGALAISCIGYSLWLDALIIYRPLSAPLPPADRLQYQVGDPAGIDNHAIALALFEEYHSDPTSALRVLVVGEGRVQLRAYIGRQTGTVLDDPIKTEEEQRRIADWLAGGSRLYLVDATLDEPLPSYPYGIIATERIPLDPEYPTPFELYRVTAIGGSIGRMVYSQRVPATSVMDDQYSVLASTLAGGQGPVYVFPPEHAEALARFTERAVMPIPLERWPPVPDAAEEALAELALAEDGTPIDVILVDEAAADPERILLFALEKRLYRQGDTWTGLLHHIRYVGGPRIPAMQPIGSVFEHTITLKSAAVLDGAPEPGGVVRLMLEWTTPVEVRDSFMVFVHISSDDEMLWAQHDGVPVSGLLPMPEWTILEPVLDRFAIQIPPDIPDGRYTVWIGIYQPESGLRLPVTDGPGSGQDRVPLGTISISR